MTNRFTAGAILLAGVALSGTAGATVYPTAVAPIALGAGAYTQNFDTLASTGSTGTAFARGLADRRE